MAAPIFSRGSACSTLVNTIYLQSMMFFTHSAQVKRRDMGRIQVAARTFLVDLLNIGSKFRGCGETVDHPVLEALSEIILKAVPVLQKA